MTASGLGSTMARDERRSPPCCMQPMKLVSFGVDVGLVSFLSRTLWHHRFLTKHLTDCNGTSWRRCRTQRLQRRRQPRLGRLADRWLLARRFGLATMSSTPEDALYPPIEPFDSGYLQVSPLHRIYYEQAGNPNGTPALFLHGGPGGGIEPIHRQFFDPEHYRIILFDQRGSGKSLPHAELKENTTWHLVDDIIQLRQHLGISRRMLVFGGSWGSSLALAFAITYPELVLALVLRGIFTLRDRELAWFYEGHGADRIFPEAWQDFIAPIPPEERVGQRDLQGELFDPEQKARLPLIHAYYKRLTSPDLTERMRAASAWSIWEGRTSHLRATVDAEDRYGKPDFAEAFARIECHYFVHGGFFERDGWLIEASQCARIRDIPCTIVQGRYDIVCPFETAWLLKNQLPQATFIVVEDAGHSAMEPGIQRHLVIATDQYRALSDNFRQT